MTNIATERSLLESLTAYVKHFETPNTREDLLAIASSILTFQQKQGGIPSLDTEQIQQVVNQFNAESVVNSIVDSTTETLVQEVNQWRLSLENQVLNTLNAYVKQFKPDGLSNLSDTILSIIPLVENFLLGKPQAESLVQQVISKFDLQTALAQVIGTEPLAITEKLAKLLQFGNIEDLLKKNVLELDHTLEGITESLVNNELEKIIGNKTVIIDIEFKDFMVKQVTLKLNIMQSSPPPSKSDEEIAKQLQSEIEILKKERQKQIGTPDISKPATLGPLQVGIKQ
ncbi:hypothetical protein APA_4242 [Pseudanabaena sp. lw0831]|uniref:hypothetical protein n=1 Tax=Pseudanabaena sp. lw0831 TaxID=1357935 RepID=UPI0019161118|nr:hypothetical protein [Pseudanabaena sp. lw0831]GBO56036.1 hypothetical protein APA_4242 [Pseudanabaena sp. lw0831]